MAIIRSINMEKGEIILNLTISEEEYSLTENMKEMIIVPENFDESLTTGKLGNSNRIMLPKKILKKHDIELRGKAPAKIFEMGGKKFLLIKLEEKRIGIPEFKE